MDTRKNKKKTRKTIITAIIAILFGYLGIHDFILKKNKKGIAHLAISFSALTLAVLAFFPLLFLDFSCGSNAPGSCLTGFTRVIEKTLAAILEFGINSSSFFLSASWEWGIVEGVILLSQLRKKK